MFVPVYQPLPPVWDGVESVLLHHRWSLSRCTLRLRLACPWKPVHCTGLACFSRPKHCKHQQSHKGKHFLPLPGPDFLHVSTNHKMITNCKCFIKEQHDGIWIPLVGSWDRPSSLHQRGGGAKWCSTTQNWFLPTITTQEVMLIRTKMNQNDKSSGPGCWRCSVFASRPGEFGSYQLHWGIWLVESEICKKMWV